MKQRTCVGNALVLLGIKEEEESGMKVPITPSHNVEPASTPRRTSSFL
jgi:hypothetical protein